MDKPFYLCIKYNGEYLEFEIKVETYIPLSEMNVISSNKEEDWSIIKVKFKNEEVYKFNSLYEALKYIQQRSDKNVREVNFCKF